MTDRDALIDAVIAQPDDDTPRLVFADWLDEFTDEHAYAEFIRVQCEKERLSGLEWKTIAGESINNSADHLRYEALEKQERHLWIDLIASTKSLLNWSDLILHRFEDQPSFTPYEPEAYVRRGFIENLACSFVDWISRSEVILQEQPVMKVRFLTWPTEEEFPDDGAKVLARKGKPSIWWHERWPGIEFELPVNGRWISRATLDAVRYPTSLRNSL